jgi:ribosomal protein L20
MNLLYEKIRVKNKFLKKKNGFLKNKRSLFKKSTRKMIRSKSMNRIQAKKPKTQDFTQLYEQSYSNGYKEYISQNKPDLSDCLKRTNISK